MRAINYYLQITLLIGTLGLLGFTLVDPKVLIMLPLALIPIGFIQYVSSIILLVLFKERDLSVFVTIATITLILFFLGITMDNTTLAITTMGVGCVLALYYVFLSLIVLKPIRYES